MVEKNYVYSSSYYCCCVFVVAVAVVVVVGVMEVASISHSSQFEVTDFHLAAGARNSSIGIKYILFLIERR